jgi:hypothetical protein
MSKEKIPIDYDNLLSFKHKVKELDNLVKVSKALRSQILKDLRTIDFDLQKLIPWLYNKQKRGYITDINNNHLVGDCEYIISKYEGILKEKEIEIVLSDGESINSKEEK